MHAQLKEKNENHAAAPLESLVSYEARSQSLAFAAQISSRGVDIRSYAQRPPFRTGLHC